MSVKTLTYLDLSVEQRRESAKRARAQVRQQLSTVEAGSDVHRLLLTKLDKLHRWENGTLIDAPKKP